MKTSQGVPSPYWPSFYRSSTVLESEGAGVVVGLLSARYLSSPKGQFLSQDPVFLGLGVDSRTNQALVDPQIQHSYSYARNNPISYKDPSGEILQAAFIIYGAAMTAIDIYEGYNVNFSSYKDGYTPEQRDTVNFQIGLNLLTRGIRLGTTLSAIESAALDVSDVIFDIAGLIPAKEREEINVNRNSNNPELFNTPAKATINVNQNVANQYNNTFRSSEGSQRFTDKQINTLVQTLKKLDTNSSQKKK